MFDNIVCSYWLFPYFGMKHPEISEEVRHDILFPGRHDILFAMSCNYLDQSDDAYYRIIIFRYNSVFFMFCSAGIVIAITFAVVVVFIAIVTIIMVVRNKKHRKRTKLKIGTYLTFIYLKRLSNIHY